MHFNFIQFFILPFIQIQIQIIIFTITINLINEI